MVASATIPWRWRTARAMLERLLTALEHPRVDGVSASADIMDDLALLGALHDEVCGGDDEPGRPRRSDVELDDRFTAYDTAHLIAANLDAGKMLLRIDYADAGTVPTLHSCARPYRNSTMHRMMAMVEPIPYTKNDAGRAVWDHDPHKLLRAVGVSAAFGGSWAYTWLKIQATADIGTIAAMTTQPLLLLGGAPGPDPEATFAMWERALQEPTVPRAGGRAGAALSARRRCRRVWSPRAGRTGRARGQGLGPFGHGEARVACQRGEVVVTHPCVGQRVGLARVLFGFDHEPSRVARVMEHGEDPGEVDGPVARHGEHTVEHGLHEAHVVAPRPLEHLSAHVFAMHMDHPRRVPGDEANGVGAGERAVAGIEQQPNGRA